MFKCYSCGNETVVWGGDHDFEDVGADGEGVVSNYSCQTCNAYIEVYVDTEGVDSEWLN